MSQSVTSSLYVKLVADAGDWESGMAAATSATQKFEAAAKKAARSPGLQSSIGSGEQAQIRKALELRQRYAGMGGDVAGPVRVTDKMVSDESERIILNRLVRSRNAEEQRAAAASAASNHIIMVQKSEAEAFALSERKKELAISLVNQAIANASELERQQALVTANAIAQTEAKKQAAIEQTAVVNARISEAMALQRGQVLAGMTAPSGNKINAQTSMLVQQAELEAKVIQETEAKKQAAIEQTAAVNARISQAMALQRGQVLADMTAPSGNRINASNSMFAQQAASATIETKRLWSAQTQAKVAANALAYSLGTTAAGGAAGATRNFGSTAADSTRKYARFGVVMQQAGYQVQDFAVQVAGGQNKLVAFSQQGAQLLGVFGVGGAIAGAVLSTGVLIARMSGLGDEMGKQKTVVDTLAESFRQLAIAKNPALAEKFASLDLNTAKNAYDDQNKLINKQVAEIRRLVAVKKESLKSKTTTADDVNLQNTFISFEMRRLKKYQEELNVLQENLNKAGGGPTETARKAFEDQQNIITAGINAAQNSRKETYSSFLDAKKLNDLDEMNNDQKLDFYLKQMKFLELIGLKQSADYEIAKKRTRELGTILLGESGPKEIKTLDQYNKTVAGLQSKVPESLGLNQGALSSGLLVGGASPSALIDISQQILAGIRQLVNIEYMGQRSY